MKDKVVIVSGPTATGKSSFAIKLALHFKLPIVNFDSLCFYNELNIGTAKPTIEERNIVPHFLIDIASIRNPLTAADFASLAKEQISKLHKKYKAVIIVGGSGFYLRALMEGMYPSPRPSEEIQQKSEYLYQQQGITPFLEILKTHDEESYRRLHPNDHYRIRRAVEHFWAHETPFSEAAKKLNSSQRPQWDFLHLYLDIEKKKHLEIITTRTEKMIESGLLNEVEALLKSGYTGMERPFQSIGYKESVAYLKKEITSLDELKEGITISTRQLAKSQRTWFKKITPKVQINPICDYDKCIDLVGDFINNLD